MLALANMGSKSSMEACLLGLLFYIVFLGSGTLGSRDISCVVKPSMLNRRYLQQTGTWERPTILPREVRTPPILRRSTLPRDSQLIGSRLAQQARAGLGLRPSGIGTRMVCLLYHQIKHSSSRARNSILPHRDVPVALYMQLRNSYVGSSDRLALCS